MLRTIQDHCVLLFLGGQCISDRVLLCRQSLALCSGLCLLSARIGVMCHHAGLGFSFT